MSNPAAAKGISELNMESLNSGSYAVPSSFIRGADNTTFPSPKAYINYILFDDQFRYSGGGASIVGNSGVIKNHWNDPVLQNILAAKSGYLYVYVSNESNVDVFFDNLQVVHKRGPILEETHYYPFGLTMGGISSKAEAFGGAENKQSRFQKQEFDSDLGVNYYGFKWRIHDPQIGKFVQIDPLSEKYFYNSTYAFSENKVTSHIELEGLEAIGINFFTWCYLTYNSFKARTNNALNAAVSEASGYNNVNPQAPKPVQNLQRLSSKITNYVAMAQPVVDVVHITNIFASFIPSGEAGAVSAITGSGFKIAGGSAIAKEAFNVPLNIEGKAIVNAFAKDAELVKSFTNCEYVIVEAQQDLKAVRVFGGSSGEKGSFFGFTTPSSSVEAEGMYFLKAYGNDASFFTPVTIKKGTQMAIGKVNGGTESQIYIPASAQSGKVTYWTKNSEKLPE
jgi:RHS repeat-associated protein